ncbi:MAG TPA: D-glycerate dehydrogenase [Chloroflexota bacterium]|nr:D-glycerate dehydrogenase [Chloroflexota bacterium]
MTGTTGSAQARPEVFCSWHFPDEGLTPLREVADVRIWEGPEGAPREVLLEALSRAAAGIFLPPTDRLDREAMDGAPNLKVISGFGVGYDYVDVPEATRRGIMVCNTPGTLTETTADQAWALLLAAARNVARGDQFVRSGAWQKYEPALLLGADVHGATLGIVGLGAIGSAVARRATGFGMRILYSGRSRKPEAEALTGAEYRPLDDLLKESDFVSLNCALTPETRGLIGDRELGLMKPTAILVNTARGGVVDQRALATALRAGQIAGAGIDVYEKEPVDADDPLLACESAVLVPHLGSATHPTRARMARVAAENIVAGLQGRRPAHLVNPEVWKG